jgi:hypothetical protein
MVIDTTQAAADLEAERETIPKPCYGAQIVTLICMGDEHDQ